MAIMEFSEAERLKIDEAARKITNGETLTSDEALLFAKFEAWKAITSEEFKANQERMEREYAEQRELNARNNKEARKTRRELVERAKERYERTLNDGK